MDNKHDQALRLKRELAEELTQNILPYWINNMQDPRGGFYGRIDSGGKVHPESPKGAVLNARILWTFSSAWRLLKKPDYLQMALRAKEEVIGRFVDSEYGGVFWTVDAAGSPLDTKKQTYATAFAIYGLSEHVRATGDKESLDMAVRLYHDIETHCADEAFGGYFEAFGRQWDRLADMRLGEKDLNANKTMNTHLHVLEAYANLYRVWPDAELAERLRTLIRLFGSRIVNPQTGRLRLYFHTDWEPYGDNTSYGHDIEASWLLQEASSVLADKKLLDEVESLVFRMATALRKGAGLPVICHLPSAQWWEYAEAVVGFFNLWQHTRDDSALDDVLSVWDFIKNHLIDLQHGEWWWSVEADGHPSPADDKAGIWKCPYHNGRMCMEIIQRL